MESNLLNSQDFLEFSRNALRFEKSKLVLPVVLCLILFSSIIYGLDFRDNQKTDEKYIDSISENLVDEFILNMEMEFYPEESNVENQTELREYINRQNSQDKYITKSDILALSPSLIATETAFYPLSPNGFTQFNKLEITNPLYTADKGYVATKEIYAGQVEAYYKISKLSNLAEEINQTNMSYNEFETKFNEINSSEYKDEQVRRYVFSETKDNSTQIGTGVSIVENMDSNKADLYLEKIKNNNLKEIKLFHFLPTLLASFIAYYIVSGFFIEGWRSFKSNSERLSKEPNFFRNNILISAILSSIIALIITITETMYISQGKVFIAVIELIISSIFWIIVFSTLTNYLKNKTSYAWIITGSGLTMITVALSLINQSMLYFRYQVLVETLLLGVTPIYTLILGILTQKGHSNSKTS